MAAKKQAPREPEEAARQIVKRHSKAPLAFYKLKDWGIRLTSHPNFFDAVVMLVAFAAVVSALPSYPLIITAVIMLLLLLATLRHPLLGLVVLMCVTMPALMYQTPALAWMFMVIVSICLVFGYMHYRTIGFIFLYVALAFSPLGLIFAIPAFLISIIVIGYKRGIVLCVAGVIGIVMLSGATGVQNTAYILYNAQLANQNIANSGLMQYLVPSKQMLPITQFISGMGGAVGNFTNGQVISGISATMGVLVLSLGVQPLHYLIQLAGLIAVVMAVEWFAVNSRSRYTR
jgi:hypothetical protein